MRYLILITLSALSLLAPVSSFCSTSQLTFKADKRYVVFPIKSAAPQSKVAVLTADKKEYTDFKVRIVSDSAEYLMPYDISDLSGRTITLASSDGVDLSGVYLSDTIPGESSMYREKYRPQYHYSAKRGWINDPNGLVYSDGEYHLFYQYNPVDPDWGNLNWGHAVSKDLVHWRELPIAIRMGEDGEIYSGSAVVDYNNDSGLAKDGIPPMLAFYTLQVVRSPIYDHDGQMQCLAYSYDNGRTFEKYEGNPIVDTRMKGDTWHNRDPKVFYYAPGQHWVMALHEKDGHSFYTSHNLIDWEYQSHLPGFWECPELFELEVDGNPDNRKWVLTGASGTYMIGDFDGKQFIPGSGKHLYASGYMYAAQTFNQMPDNRRVQIGWSSIRKPGMPFTGQMMLPVELTLTDTKDGPRLRAMPVKEVETLLKPVFKASDISMEEANKLLADKVKSTERLLVRAKMRMTHPTNAGLNVDGSNVLNYDLNFNKINDVHYFPQDIGSMSLEFDMYLDAMSVETFFDNGLYCEIKERPELKTEGSLQFWSNEPMSIDKLEVYEISSIWE